MTIEIFKDQEDKVKMYEGRKFIKYVRTDRNGTRIFEDRECGKCGGKGRLPEYAHIEGGVCFQCRGTGVSSHVNEIKVYTDEYGAKLQAKRLAKELADEAKRWQSCIEKEGFTPEGKMCIILGDTYAIKEELKAEGCKFSREYGWHCTKTERPAFELDVNDISSISEEGFHMWKTSWEIHEFVADKKREAEQKLSKASGHKVSDWIGKEKERREFSNCKLVAQFEFESNYCGWGSIETSYIYKFEDADGNIIVWKTQKSLNELEEYNFVATIKCHDEYKGEKQTVITRPKFN